MLMENLGGLKDHLEGFGRFLRALGGFWKAPGEVLRAPGISLMAIAGLLEGIILGEKKLPCARCARAGLFFYF